MMFGKDDNKVRVSNAQITTFIGADTTVEGKVITRSSVRIDGTVVGGVVADGTVVLSETGQIQGNVMAENIIVSGVVDGNMEIRDKVNIEPTGEVYGDITTAKILIDEESVFQGKCNMNRDKETEKKRRLFRKQEEEVEFEDEAVGEEPVARPKLTKKESKKKKDEIEIEVLDDNTEIEPKDDVEGDSEEQ